MRWFICDLKWIEPTARPPIECACREHAEAMYYMGGYQGNSFVYVLDEKRRIGTTILWYDTNNIRRAEDWASLERHENFHKMYLKPETRKVIDDRKHSEASGRC